MGHVLKNFGLVYALYGNTFMSWKFEIISKSACTRRGLLSDYGLHDWFYIPKDSVNAQPIWHA